MSPQGPSRRSLLTVLLAALAGLFGLSRATATPSAVPPSPPAPPPLPPPNHWAYSYTSPAYSTYQGSGQLTTCTDPVGSVTTLVYDAQGNRLR